MFRQDVVLGSLRLPLLSVHINNFEHFKKRLEEVQQQPFSVADLKINGFDVMKELNVKPGKIIGEIGIGIG